MGTFLKSLGLQALTASRLDRRLVKSIPSRNEQSVTLNTVVGLPAAFRSIQLLTTLGSQVQFNAWRDTQMVERQPVVVRKPDPWRVRRSWTVRVLTNFAADGNNFLKLGRNPLDETQVVSQEALNPFAVRVRRDKNGRKVFDHRRADGVTETLSTEQVRHIWLNEFPGFDRGVSPITACRLTFAGALDTRDYARTVFGAIPPGVLTSDQQIDDVTAKAHQTRWHDGEAGLIKVMGRGLSFQPIFLKPEDAQWIESQKFTVLDMARLFGVPPYRLAAAIEGSSYTYQQLPDINQDYIDATLDPVYIAPVVAEWTDVIANGQEVRPDYAALLRRDLKYQLETHKLAIDAGIWDVAYAQRDLGIDSDTITTPATTPKESA